MYLVPALAEPKNWSLTDNAVTFDSAIGDSKLIALVTFVLLCTGFGTVNPPLANSKL